MRNIKTIEADIAKLQAELADVKENESMRDAAVNILKNLGWTRQKGRWVQPAVTSDKVNIRGAVMSSVQTGDFVKTISGEILYIRATRPRVTHPYGVKTFECSKVLKIEPGGTKVACTADIHPDWSLTKINPGDYMGYVAK